MERWTQLLGEVLRGILRPRERPLPREILKGHLDSFFRRKEVFLESASHFGTPQYFLDRPALLQRIGQFKKTFEARLRRFRGFYAVKSNSFPEIARCAMEAGFGLDVSSGLELLAAIELGCRRIIFSGPGKTKEDLRLAMTHRERVTILMDSSGELERIRGILGEKANESQGSPVRVGVRIRGGHHGIWEKFGIPLKELGPLLERASCTAGVDFQGIQFHTSWNLDPRAQVEMIRNIGSHIRDRIPRGSWARIRFMDIGGGYWPESGEWLNPSNTMWGKLVHLFSPGFEFHPQHYRLTATPLERFAAEISGEISRGGPPLTDMEIWAEPGRWICTPSMHILLRIVDKKEETIAITDGGTNLLGWERPLHEFVPVLNLSRPSHNEMRVRIFGSLCTPLDIWGMSIFGRDVLEGDIILIPDQGAYTYSLRQSFIKPKARVVQYDGRSLMEVEREEIPMPFQRTLR